MSCDWTALEMCGVVVKEKAPLCQWTTFQLGGCCSRLFLCATPVQLEQTVSTLFKNQIAFILIGSGSNLVVSDYGMDCAVIRYVSDVPMINYRDDEITVSGSTHLDHLALYAAQQGLDGLTFISGIPGTVGGAIVGNAGAFGQQVGDVLKSITLLYVDGKKSTVMPEDLDFTYRNSRLKETGDIVIEAIFKVSPGQKTKLLKQRDEILEIRWQKHPDLKVYPCAGSFFRNIEPTSQAQRRQATGWFLEQAGGKDLAVGGAVIFPQHANIIVKSQGCTAQNVYDLAQQMAALVKKNYDMDIVREVRFVGKFDGVPESEKTLIW